MKRNYTVLILYFFAHDTSLKNPWDAHIATFFYWVTDVNLHKHNDAYCFYVRRDYNKRGNNLGMGDPHLQRISGFPEVHEVVDGEVFEFMTNKFAFPAIRVRKVQHTSLESFLTALQQLKKVDPQVFLRKTSRHLMKAQKTILPLMKKSPRRRRLSQPRQNLLQNLLFLKMRVVRMKFQRRTSQLSQMLQRRLLSRKIAAQERKNHLKKRRVLMRRKTLKPQRKILMWKWLMLHHLRKWPLNSMDQIKFDWP